MNKILFSKKKYNFFYNFINNFINIKKNNFKKKILLNLNLNKIIFFLEYKRQSPYKGLYFKNIIDIIKKYEIFGCFCLSILNECYHFKCNFIDFFYIKKYSNLFILRKDFIFNEFQIFNSFLLGYDVVLILTNLNILLLKNFYFLCKKLKIFIILEIHNLKSLKKIRFLNPIFIGINNRNLKNLIINKKIFFNIVRKTPSNCIIISESGLNSSKNIKFLIDNNVRVFLIGDYFLSKINFYKKISNLMI